MFINRLRERFPDAPVTETHPKAVAIALGGWDRVKASFPEVVLDNEHQRDASLAAIAAREGFLGRWRKDLAFDRHASEQDPQRYWLGPINYFWPTG
jgi:predicted nuclease with RNAse H fold